ncbi:hypothetical protein OPQ81_000850 [Rhizoctonia solani]|nr:hypothetical protein OPQ81_000850 [Rhizoctonia solani]
MPDAENRRPLTVAALLVPSTVYLIVIYYASNKRLFPYRNIFAPIALFTIWETCTHYAILDPRFNVWNFFLGAAGCTLAMKLVAIATLKHPLKRKFEITHLISEAFTGALTRIAIFLQKLGLLRTCSISRLIRSFSLIGSVGSIHGGSVFVWTHIPFPFHGIPVPPFITACFVTFLAGLMAYNALSAIHFFTTFLLAPFYSEPAKSWPPLFGNPLHAVSVYNFWSYQWHSVLRHGFCSTGGKLGWEIGGSTGAVLGVFLVSGLLHDFGLWCMGRGMEFRRVTMYFVLQGIVVLLEKTFDVDVWIETIEMEDAQKYNLKASITGFPKQTRIPRKNSLVDHGLGQLWTAFWIIVPATLMVDAGAQRGFFSIPFNFPLWG